MGRISHHLKGKDYKKTHQRKLDEQRALYLERREKEIQEEKEKKKIEESAKPFKSNWRNTLTEAEWIAISGPGPTNSTAQTFEYGGPGGPQATFSGLGGVEAYPSTVTIDGETYNAPTYNQLALAGYAKPLGFDVTRRTDFQDVNLYLDASQQFAQAVGADYMMNARTEYDPVQALKDDIPSLINMWNRIDSGLTSDPRTFTGLGPESESTIQTMIGFEKYDQIKRKYELSSSIDQGITSYIAMVNEFKSAFWNSVYEKTGVKVDFGISSPSNKEIPPIKYADTIWGDTYDRDSKKTNITNLGLNRQDQQWLNDKQRLVDYLKGLQNFGGPAVDFAQWAINWAKGDYTPIKQFSPQMRNDILDQIAKSLVNRPNDRTVQYHDYELLTNNSTRLGLGRFHFDIGPNGVRVKDNFDVDLGAAPVGGILHLIPGLQNDANKITELGNKVGAGKGRIPIDVTIPWSQVPANLKNKLRKKTQEESTTWNRTKKHLKGA